MSLLYAVGCRLHKVNDDIVSVMLKIGHPIIVNES